MDKTLMMKCNYVSNWYFDDLPRDNRLAAPWVHRSSYRDRWSRRCGAAGGSEGGSEGGGVPANSRLSQHEPVGVSPTWCANNTLPTLPLLLIPGLFLNRLTQPKEASEQNTSLSSLIFLSLKRLANSILTRYIFWNDLEIREWQHWNCFVAWNLTFC